jgi:DNA-directed RNA polymerase alpha subunit
MEFACPHCGERFRLLLEAAPPPENKQRLLDKTIHDLKLSIRSYNCLYNAGILTVGQIVRHTERSLLARKHLGRKSLNEIKYILAEMDLSLRAGDMIVEYDPGTTAQTPPGGG